MDEPTATDPVPLGLVNLSFVPGPSATGCAIPSYPHSRCAAAALQGGRDQLSSCVTVNRLRRQQSE